MLNMDVLESNVLKSTELDFNEKMFALNKLFVSKITPENGIYGKTETIRDNGVTERLGINEFGRKIKDYMVGGQLYKQRELLGGGYNATTFFDDVGTACLRIITNLEGNQKSVLHTTHKPNEIIVEGNFTSKIDRYGRPILNRVTDVQLKPANEARKSLHAIERDGAYRVGDQKGHLIADSLGGTATRENIVPQLDKVNQREIAKVENIVRKLKLQGHTVDFEMKANYIGSKSGRPTSFEPRIIVDGKEYMEIPKELQKIYNFFSDTPIKRIAITAGERFWLPHEIGMKSGLVAAGLICATSTVEHISAFIDGKLVAEEMITEIVEDVALAGALGYGTAFISTAVSQAMTIHSNAFISRVGSSCLPAVTIAFAIESYQIVSSYAQGNIDGGQLAYELGKKAAGMGGNLAGGVVGGAAFGSVAGPVGIVAGALVGGLVGCVLTTEMYKTAAEMGIDGTEFLAERTEQFANIVIDTVAEIAPEQLDTVKAAFQDFTNSVQLSIQI